ncbi:hypothetical protein PIB30_092472, partial [Stylosanthes scabra]|nr:hypothetical protein [Stylosanthes scabra]
MGATASSPAPFFFIMHHGKAQQETRFEDIEERSLQQQSVLLQILGESAFDIYITTASPPLLPFLL